MYMELLSKKTTILLPPTLHSRLTRLAEQRHTSLGDLIRSACQLQYGVASREERLAAVRRLAAMNLPVGTPSQIKAESVPHPDELMP